MVPSLQIWVGEVVAHQLLLVGQSYALLVYPEFVFVHTFEVVTSVATQCTSLSFGWTCWLHEPLHFLETVSTEAM